MNNSPEIKLYWLATTYSTGGILVKDNVIFNTAPIYGWAIRKRNSLLI